MDDKSFYVYVYLNPLKPGKFQYERFTDEYGYEKIDRIFEFEPFYIGAGKDRRLFAHIEKSLQKKYKENNRHKINTIKKILAFGISKENFENNFIIKLEENHTRFMAFEIIERFYIRVIGRDNIKTGPLTNLTPGGDGGDTLKGKTWEDLFGKEKAEELRLKTSERMKNDNPMKYIDVSGENNGFYGKKHTEQFKKEKSEKFKGIKWEEIYGEEKAKELKKQRSDFLLENHPYKNNKTYEEVMGKEKAKERKEKISKKLKGKKNPSPKKYECEYCHKFISKGNYTKWHGKNCKEKIGNENIIRISANKGKHPQKVECDVCHKFISKSNYNQFHGEKCGKPNKIKCEYCNKELDHRNYLRWHGEKCKNK